MSSYGPPGPQSGQPRDPRGQQPSDPWGNPDQWPAGQGPDPRRGPGAPGSPVTPSPNYGGPSYGGPQYQPGYGHPQPAYPQQPQPGYGQQYPGYEQPTYGQPNYGQQTGYHDPWYGHSTFDAESAPGQPQVWTQPEPPKKGSRGLIVTIISVLAVLVFAGGATAFYLAGKDDKTDTNSTPQAAGNSPDQAQASDEPSAGSTVQSPTPGPESSAEARFAAKGQCLVNDGSNEQPKMRIVKCSANTYEVLARYDGTIDYKNKCAKVPGYQYHYYFDSELDVLDFVLCLKKR